MSRKMIIPVCIALVLLSTSIVCPAAAEEEKILNIYFWFDYIPESIVKKFEQETGIKVVLDTFESLNMVETKLLAGNSGYDIVMPSAAMADRLKNLKLFQKLDKTKLKNYGNLDPEILSAMAKADPGNNYGVPYMWGTTGIGFNVDKVRERLPNANLRSWDLLFKPENISKLADCGVAFIDEYYHVIPIALHYLGLDPHSVDKKDLKKADELLMSIRPYIRHFNTGAIIEELATGEICAALSWNGDTGMAMARAEELNSGNVIDYSIPEEGTVMFVDFMAIPEDAEHPDNAHKFLDFLMRPEEIAKVSNYVFYANGNTASLPYVDEAVKGDPDIYPTEKVKKKLFPETFAPQKNIRNLTRMWTEFKAAK